MNAKLNDYLEVICYSIREQLQKTPEKKVIEIFIEDESSSLINEICEELVQNKFDVCYVPKACINNNHPKVYDKHDYDGILYISWKNRNKLMLVY